MAAARASQVATLQAVHGAVHCMLGVRAARKGATNARTWGIPALEALSAA